MGDGRKGHLPHGSAMKRFTVEHTTIYRYRRPVSFGEHRMMFRPRDSHDLRLLDSQLVLSPAADIRWYHDVFSNSIAVAQFTEPAAELVLKSMIRLEQYPLSAESFAIEENAETLPFSYSATEIPDLGRTAERHYADPEHLVDRWVRQFFGNEGRPRTEDFLVRMTHAIKEQFTYQARDEYGVQSPVETLRRGSGTCRDYALLMMEGARSVGLAARFVSGYLYDPAVDGGGEEAIGAGATHAWVQVYLPGAGWVEFDPTNGIVGGENLIRVAVVREPAQAVPVNGSYDGTAEDFLGMEVEVRVTRGAGN